MRSRLSLVVLIVFFAMAPLLLSSPPKSHAEGPYPGLIGSEGGGNEGNNGGELASTINGVYIRFGTEYGYTTIWMRVCADSPNFQLRSESVGNWITEVFNRTTASGGCSPSPTTWWRMVYLAVPGPQVFRIYATANDIMLSEAAFMRRATRTDCVVTGYGTGTCTPSTTGGPIFNPPPFSAPLAFLDEPVANASIGETLNVGGWAIDTGSWNGTGVDQVEVLINGNSIGFANYYGDRPDVASQFGDSRFRYSGFWFSTNTRNLPKGVVTLQIRYRSTISGATTTIQRQINILPTINIRPNPPNLLNPAHAATINTSTVTLQVTDGGDADNWPNQTRRFRFIIASSDNSWRADSGWINSTSWTVQLPRIGEYVWQAQANDGADDSDLTVQRKLYYTIAVPVPPPPPPTPAPNVWPVPYLSQLNDQWKTQPINRPAYATYCNNTIGQIGCALTSLTMVARFYGVNHNPGTMNTCLGAYACPLYWSSQQVRTCTNNKMRWVSWPIFSYANLQAELRKGPVILELSTSAGYMHFIVVLGGSGTDPANYTVHDPGVRNGAYTTLANVLRYWRRYQPSSMRIYTGTPAPLPANLAAEEATTDSLASQAANVESDPIEPLASPPLLNGVTITGAIAPYRNTSTEMVLELAAQSAAGAVTEMRVWTNAEQSTVWQPFSRYVSVPLAETYYVQFRDAQGNTSAVISTGLPQVRNLNVFATFIPLTIR